jgi:serine/threonine protein kinase
MLEEQTRTTCVYIYINLFLQKTKTNTNKKKKNRAMTKIHSNSWVRGKCIGKGAFGVVNLAYSKSDSSVFAVKSVDLKTGHPNQLQALENEIQILKRLSSYSSSSHVVSFYGEDVTCEGEGTMSFKNLHLEYMPGGTVADMDRADVDERLVRSFAWCLVNALSEIHARGVVHCDVKGRNVLVAGDGSIVKLADFGSAVEFELSGGECEVPRGSPMWMAPEVIRREYQGPESDVWSLGCTLIEILTGKSPWEDHGIDTLSRIGFSNELPEFPSGLSELGRDFLEKCLQRDRSRRWRCDQLLQHPFLLPCDRVVESSPRCVLDWVDSQFTESENEFESELEFEENEMKLNNSDKNLFKNRISKLATGLSVNWESDDWVVVRSISSEEKEPNYECDEVGVTWEFENVVRVEEEMEVGASLVNLNCNERVKREMWKFGKKKRLLWRCEWKYNRNRRNSIIGGSGSCCGWICRYRYGWGKFNRNINFISGIFSIFIFCCKIIKSCYLFSIYYPFWFKKMLLLHWCLKLKFWLKIIKGVFILNLVKIILRRLIIQEVNLKKKIIILCLVGN